MTPNSIDLSFACFILKETVYSIYPKGHMEEAAGGMQNACKGLLRGVGGGGGGKRGRRRVKKGRVSLAK